METLAFKKINNPVHQRSLRSDHGELTVIGLCKLHERGIVARIDRNIFELGFDSGSSVPWGHKNGSYFCRLCQLPS